MDEAVADLRAGHPEWVEGFNVMDVLAAHIPLTLLLDLVSPDGPVSPAILESEGLPDSPWWEKPGA